MMDDTDTMLNRRTARAYAARPLRGPSVRPVFRIIGSVTLESEVIGENGCKFRDIREKISEAKDKESDRVLTLYPSPR